MNGPAAQFQTIFFEECRDLLADAEATLLRLQAAARDAGQAQLPPAGDVDAVFRSVHSIKGGAAALGFAALVAYAHRLEAALDRLRVAPLALDDATLGLLLRGLDHLADHVDAAREGTEPDPGSIADAEDLAAIEAALGASASSSPPSPSAASPSASGTPASAATRRVHIRFHPGAELFTTGNEPLFLFRELAAMGTLHNSAQLPAELRLDGFDPHQNYLGWDLVLETDRPLDEIADIFAFVADCGDFTLTEEAEPTEHQGQGEHQGPTAGRQAVLHAASPSDSPPDSPPDSPSADRQTSADRANADRPNTDRAHTDRAPTTVRVDLDRLDRLVDMVGEIVITQAMLSQQTAGLRIDQHSELLAGMEQMALHTRELQEAVMALRAQPVKSVFDRMQRVARETAAQVGKTVVLVTTGEATEVDKTIIEQLADPLTHLIRNAIDHGIEAAADRLAAGKPAEGHIVLSAEHRSGTIVITVADDGRGLNCERIREKAIERGLATPDAALSEAECAQLIFHPGFSTAATVSSVSGRGVGMDVVRRNIEDMGGRIQVASQPGRGTHFTLTLPLTLAVLDGMLLRVGHERYVLPITAIHESLRPLPDAVLTLPGGERVMRLRGDYIALVGLGAALGEPAAEGDPCKALVVVVEAEGGRRIGLIVDELIGQQQVVIKSLMANYGNIAGISAATILGDGRVALIVDIDSVARLAPSSTSSSTPPSGAAGTVASRMVSQSVSEGRVP